MEVENHNAFPSYHSSHNGSSSSTPDILPLENHPGHLTRPTFCTVIPNRIFVRGIQCKVSESDLRRVFSQYGAVKEVKMVIDRYGVSKRYGFVTFETQEDVLKILNDAKEICFEDKKLYIDRAFRKHQTLAKNPPLALPEPTRPYQMTYGTFYLTTSTGCPYTYHNGVAYFHCPNMNPEAPHWSPASQLLVSQSHQPLLPQPTYHHYQSAPNHGSWNTVQAPMQTSGVVYTPQSDYLLHASDGGSFQPPVPLMEDAALEIADPTVPHIYPGIAPTILRHDPANNLMFASPPVFLKPKPCRYATCPRRTTTICQSDSQTHQSSFTPSPYLT